MLFRSYYRIENQLGTDQAKRLSPLGKVKFAQYMNDAPVELAGLNHLDYLLLYKKYNPKQEPSYKLGDIGTKYVNLGKVEYEGNLDRLFKEDVNKFIEYNFRDVEILKALDEKLEYISLTKNLSHKGKHNYSEVYANTKTQDGAISAYLLDKKIVPPAKDRNPLSKKNYAGGYLFCPQAGIYSYMFDEDLTSLYPSIIMTVNIGKETMVGRIIDSDDRNNRLGLNDLKSRDPEEELIIENIKRKKTKIKVSDLIKFIQDNKWAISANGVFFRTDKRSVLATILDKWFDERVLYKNEMKKAYKAKNSELGASFHMKQYTMKILLNSLYGATALGSFRYGNVILSESITLTGQRLTQESIKFVNEWMNKELGTDNKDYIVTSDTDSLFIQVKDLILQRKPELANADQETIVQEVLKVATEVQKLANDNLHTLVQELFNVKYPDEPHYFELKQEVVLDRGYFAGKRRYAQHIVNKEGVPTDELDVKGLDLMKSNFPPLFKRFGEHIINEIMFGKHKTDIDKQILDFRTELRTINWKQILKPTGLKKMGEYLASPPRAGEVFSKLGLKCPINTKAAIYYNDILRFKGLDKKYPTFQIGDKMFIAYLKDNPYRIDVVGFNGFNDPPEILEFVEKYIDRDGLFDSVMKNKLESLYSDLGWGAVVLNQNINKFFKF